MGSAGHRSQEHRSMCSVLLEGMFTVQHHLS
jgi:hypothetical protein